VIDRVHDAGVPSAAEEPKLRDLKSSEQIIINRYISHGLNALGQLTNLKEEKANRRKADGISKIGHKCGSCQVDWE
jgi:hypothetical protein